MYEGKFLWVRDVYPSRPPIFLLLSLYLSLLYRDIQVEFNSALHSESAPLNMFMTKYILLPRTQPPPPNTMVRITAYLRGKQHTINTIHTYNYTLYKKNRHPPSLPLLTTMVRITAYLRCKTSSSVYGVDTLHQTRPITLEIT